jgi:hypothetical protein
LAIIILKEPRDREYQKLIQYAFKTCNTFLLSMDVKILTYYPEPKILKTLAPFKIKEMKSLYYPQINYYNDDAMVYFFECNEATKTIIFQAVKGLYEWRHPDLPEDLTFLDDNGKVWMDSISHECMATINEKSNDEADLIREIGISIYYKKKF